MTCRPRPLTVFFFPWGFAAPADFERHRRANRGADSCRDESEISSAKWERPIESLRQPATSASIVLPAGFTGRRARLSPLPERLVLVTGCTRPLRRDPARYVDGARQPDDQRSLLPSPLLAEAGRDTLPRSSELGPRRSVEAARALRPAARVAARPACCRDFGSADTSTAAAAMALADQARHGRCDPRQRRARRGSRLWMTNERARRGARLN